MDNMLLIFYTNLSTSQDVVIQLMPNSRLIGELMNGLTNDR